MLTYRAIALKHEIAGFHCAGNVDNGDGATTVRAVYIRENFLLGFDRYCVPKLGRLRR